MRGRKKKLDALNETIALKITKDQRFLIEINPWIKKDLSEKIRDYLNLLLNYYQLNTSDFEVQFNALLKEKANLKKYNNTGQLHEAIKLIESDNNSIEDMKEVSSSGYVYLVTFNNEYYKIGVTKNIENRMKQLSLPFPVKLQLIHLIKTNNMYLTEKLFHEFFCIKRCKGEWFKLNPDDVKYIKSGKYTEIIMNSIAG